ncbi:MAG: serine hydrolase [Deltaproteobacteria bacterium]|nr:serine hydrolase [Deltaproteobacteria bacterium]
MSSRRLEAIVERAVTDRAFPSACLLLAKDGGEPVVHRAFGRARLDSVFDLASLTKPLATTACLMRLAAAGQLDVASPLMSIIPSARRYPVGKATIAELLAHASGLPAWHPYYEETAVLSPRAARRRVRQAILSDDLEARPGEKSIYSDLGFILLGWALERLTGTRLDRLMAREVSSPLGLRSTTFVDLEAPLATRPLLPFIPTERCPRRGRLLGEVHDDNTHALGGIAGHAGLFSTAFEVHLLVRELVAAWAGERSLFDRDVVRAFWAARPAREARGRVDGRALGWDRPSADGRSSAGRLISPLAVGHLGFTGTSVWIDLERRAWLIFLTNRVYYGRERNPMKALRPRVHDAAWRLLAKRRSASPLEASRDFAAERELTPAILRDRR